MIQQRRQQSEQAFHDRQAQQRAQGLRPDDLCFADEQYLEHECWIMPALGLLGDVRGRAVLDLGCGHGMASVVLARRGARVTACDVSSGYLREARARARANGVAVAHVGAAGERLPFADGAFDHIWGNAILHHLDLGRAAREIRRLLTPGGCAVFCEPWGDNRCLGWARRWLPYPGKARTPDESPLRSVHLADLRGVFEHVEFHGHQLLAMLKRVLPDGRLVRGLQWGDRHVLRRFPHLQRYCRYAVIKLATSAAAFAEAAGAP